MYLLKPLRLAAMHGMDACPLRCVTAGILACGAEEPYTSAQ